MCAKAAQAVKWFCNHFTIVHQVAAPLGTPHNACRASPATLAKSVGLDKRSRMASRLRSKARLVPQSTSVNAFILYKKAGVFNKCPVRVRVLVLIY